MNKGRSLTTASLLSLLAIGATSTLAQTETKTLTYDPLGRLVSSEASGGSTNGDTRTLCYDPMGNRTNFKVRNDGSVPACAAPTPTPTPSPTPSPTPTPTPTPSNNPPIANDDLAGGACGTITYYDPIANDEDPDGNYPLALLSITKTSGGDTTASIYSGNIIQINHHWNGSDVATFTYVVRDSLGATATGFLTAYSSSCNGIEQPPPP